MTTKICTPVLKHEWDYHEGLAGFAALRHDSYADWGFLEIYFLISTSQISYRKVEDAIRCNSEKHCSVWCGYCTGEHIDMGQSKRPPGKWPSRIEGLWETDWAGIEGA